MRVRDKVHFYWLSGFLPQGVGLARILFSLSSRKNTCVSGMTDVLYVIPSHCFPVGPFIAEESNWSTLFELYICMSVYLCYIMLVHILYMQFRVYVYLICSRGYSLFHHYQTFLV